MRKPALSIHPKLASGVDLVIGGIFFFFLPRLGADWQVGMWLGVRAIFFAMLLFLTYYSPLRRRSLHWLAFLIFVGGVLSWLLLIDQPLLWNVVAFVGVVAPAASFWLLPSNPEAVSFALKPERRWRLMMVIVGFAGLSTALFGSAVLQLVAPLPWVGLSAAAALVIAAISAWWWHEYGIPLNARSGMILGVVTLVSFEASLLLWWWPLGYFVSGFIFTWWWYVLWLFFRFLLSPSGIHWRKQAQFLIGNTVLMVMYLVLVARWY